MRIIGLLSCAMLLLNPFQNQLSDKNKGRDDCPTPTGFFILTNAQVNPDENNQVIRAFIPTGSKSPKVLRLSSLCMYKDTIAITIRYQRLFSFNKALQEAEMKRAPLGQGLYTYFVEEMNHFFFSLSLNTFLNLSSLG